MLDFYQIEDTISNPQKFNIKFVGQLDETTFYNLMDNGIIDERFDFYTDFRWDSKVIKQIIEKINRIDNHNVNIIRFFKLIEAANYNNCGLIAYSD